MPRRTLGWVAALVCFAGAALLPWIPGISVAIPGGPSIVKLPLHRDEEFSIRFIHSIDGLPVIEQYRVDRTAGLVQTETRFLMFGVGMGYIEGEGTVTSEGRWTVITGMNRPIGTLRQRVGLESVDHTLTWRNRSWHLSKMLPGRLLTMAPARLSAIDVARLFWSLRLRQLPSEPVSD